MYDAALAYTKASTPFLPLQIVVRLCHLCLIFVHLSTQTGIMSMQSKEVTTEISFDDFKAEILQDYRLGWESRHLSYTGRKEVLNGRAKFGIFGPGVELAQLALAKVFREGDFRSGYYRDQTISYANGITTLEQMFAQLYAHADVNHDPHSAGRQMNSHFATRSLDENGMWRDLTKIKHAAADSAPTASQMLKSVGLALASKLYRNNKSLHESKQFSDQGNEVVFATIGDASTSEGIFWEAVNAAAVQKIPLVVNVWDNGYGISVPIKYQTTKENISQALSGFITDENGNGMDIYVVKAWDYASLIETYEKAVHKTRTTHIPCLIHVVELAQPQGHSTSGSHERYKTPERLKWEEERDCLTKFKQWILKNNIATEQELQTIETESAERVAAAKNSAWDAYLSEIKQMRQDVLPFLQMVADASVHKTAIESIIKDLNSIPTPFKKDIFRLSKKILRLVQAENIDCKANLKAWIDDTYREEQQKYSSHLHSESRQAVQHIPIVAATYPAQPELAAGYEIINQYFDKLFAERKDVVAFGEDVGKIGDVNQGFAGLQDKYGELRIWDTGIREATIIGQGQGLAMRGLRPIAEIQYLDYLLYGLQPMSDDIATLQYRTKGGQKAPVIIRTRGHRLEGIWHSGSPMGMILHSLRGMHVCVPRNFTQAAGMYQTLIQSDEPALVIECLNGYRLKEPMPSNLGSYTVPLGKIETLRQGTDITMVSYGSTLRVCEEAIQFLEEADISVELIDVQTLLPFDLSKEIVESLKKTNRLVVVDEDVPGGASAFILQQVLEDQQGYRWLDAAPLTITSKAHRPAYGTDGDYFSKPNAEEIFEKVYQVMHEYAPSIYPPL